MVFRRRDRRSIFQIVAQFVYPRGGWARAFEYVKHRLRRLPDTPEKISRGVMAGVLASFTPFFGLHMVLAALVALLFRGNILAALMGTFFGNPLTYVPIALSSMTVGNWMLGRRWSSGVLNSREPGSCDLGCQFSQAASDLWQNLKALFTPAQMDWSRLAEFYNEIFYPFMIGSIPTGLVAGIVMYYVALPVMTAYQNRRRKRLRAKLDQLKKR